MADNPGLSIEHLDATGAQHIFDELISVHEDAHSELMHKPFYFSARFAERLRAYMAGAGFELVAGRVEGGLVGYAFGNPLPTDTRWWSGLEESADPDLTRETGGRTFAFREFLLRKRCQGRGHGRALHDALLTNRPESRATLLVRSDNPARELYVRWGWVRVGFLKPFADSPRFESMIITLPLAGR